MKNNTLNHFNPNLHITGPYSNKKQGRRFVTILDKVSGKRTQKTYAKYLMEVHLGRELAKEETVDHIDRNKLNDVIENLQILTPSEHALLDAKRAEKIEVNCAWCHKSFLKKPRDMRTQSKAGSAGPFCSSSCRGKYGAHISNGGLKKPTQEYTASVYSQLDKNKDND